MAHGGVAGQAHDRAPRVGVPVRGAQAHEGGHEVDPVRVRHRARQGLHVGRGGDDLQPVAQPLHDRARDEDRALQAVGHLRADLPAHGGEQAVARGDGLPARVEEHEAAGAVRVLGAAGREAGLAEGRRLLVTRVAGHADGASEERGVGLSVDLARALDLGQHAPRDAEEGEQLVVPGHLVDVEQEGAAGVAGIGGVDAAAREAPEEEAVHRPEQHVPLRRARAQPGDRVEQVLDLRAREVGVQHEAGAGAEGLLVALGLEPVADGRAHAALPDDGVGHGPARVAVPEDGGLALVGDADGGHVGRSRPRFREDLARGEKLRLPDGLRVVLDQAGPGEDLGELALGRRHRAPVPREQDGAAGGRALVEGEDVSAHAASRARSSAGWCRRMIRS